MANISDWIENKVSSIASNRCQLHMDLPTREKKIYFPNPYHIQILHIYGVCMYKYVCVCMYVCV